jgi:PKD repeat protein
LRLYLLGILSFVLIAAAAHAESASLTIAPGFPQNGTYVFDCAGVDFNATTFDWDFGDDVQVLGIPGLVQHTYIENGNYNVTCTAHLDNVSAVQSLLVTVDIFGNNTNVTPNETNTTNTTNVTNVTNVTDGVTNVTNSTNVTNVTNATNVTNVTNQTNGTNNTVVNGTANITIKAWYPQMGAYVFECNTPGFTPTMYSWFYGDGKKNENITNQNVFHTYLANGNYTVMCKAWDGNNYAEATREIFINDIPQVNTCSAMQNMAATCTGGTVTQQDFGKSCRTIICGANGTDTTVLACDKPSADNPLYFEMYRLSGSATVCLGDTCVGPNSGFARSGILACFGNQTNVTNVTNVTNGTNTTNLCPSIQPSDFVLYGQGGWGQDAAGKNTGAMRNAIFASAFPSGVVIGSGNLTATFNTSQAVEDFLPAGGPSGALNETSVNPTGTSGGTLAGQTLALALNLGLDQYNASQNPSNTSLGDLVVIQNGSVCYGWTVQQVLQNANLVLGNASNVSASDLNECVTAINEETAGFVGFACALNQTNVTPPTNQTNETNLTSGNVSLMVAPGFPQDLSYVFVCNASFPVSTYNFAFGDGSQLMGLIDNNVYHTYSSPGNYTVTCTATGGNVTGNASIGISAGTQTPPVNVTNQTNQTNTTPELTTAATLSGSQEYPPTNSTATGSASAHLIDGVLHVSGNFSGLLSDLMEVGGSSAHVHLAPLNASGPIVFPLVVVSADNRSGSFNGSAVLNSSLVDAFINDELYVNVHSNDYPTGEIRAQFMP